MINTIGASVEQDFSVYHLLRRVQATSTTLQNRRMMTYISHEIENATLIDGARTRIFAGFQYMRFFLPQVRRYTRLAQNASAVYVFGVPDIDDLPDIPNVHYVALNPYDQLAKEWFLVSYGAEYFSALATEELTTVDMPADQRAFKGVWTFDARMVSTLDEWIGGLVGLRPDDLEYQRHYERQLQLVSNGVNRLMTRVMQQGTGA